jgi:hypothetical protein
MADKIIVVGDFPIADSVKYSSVEKVMIYDIKTDAWNEGTKPPEKKLFGVVGVTSGIYAPQRVYVLGTDTNYNYMYDPVADVWSTAKAMPTARYSFSVAVVDDILYAIGGGASNTHITFLSVNEQYIPNGYNGTLPPTTSPSITPEQTNTTSSNPTSKPSDTGFPLTYIIAAAALALTIVTVVSIQIKRKNRLVIQP